VRRSFEPVQVMHVYQDVPKAEHQAHKSPWLRLRESATRSPTSLFPGEYRRCSFQNVTKRPSFCSEQSSLGSDESTPRPAVTRVMRHAVTVQSSSQVTPRVVWKSISQPECGVTRGQPTSECIRQAHEARQTAATSACEELQEESHESSCNDENIAELANQSPKKKTCSFISKSSSVRSIKRSTSSATVDDEMNALEELLGQPDELRTRAMRHFKQHVAKESTTLGMEQLESVIMDLGAALGLSLPESPESRSRLVRARMRRFNAKGDGQLSSSDFEQMYRWTLWRKYEDLNPPTLTRSNLVTATFQGSPTLHYDVQDELGKGQYGVTHRVVNRQTFHKRAMKTIGRAECVSDLRAEVELLALLDHPHILRLFELYIDDRNLFIITDLCYGGEMLDIVKEHAKLSKPLPESWVIRAFSQTLCAVAYCHRMGVMHKDLKFENIMLRKRVHCESPVDEIHVVIIDVGMSELFGDRHGKEARSKDFGGTLHTMAPEVFKRDFSHKCDTWSIGCLLFSIFNTKPLYVRDQTGQDVWYPYPFIPEPCGSDPFGVRSLRRKQRAGPPMEHINASEKAQDVIRHMLAYDENARPCVSDCLQLPWFAADEKKTIELSTKQIRALLDHSEREACLWWGVVQGSGATQLPLEQFAQLSELFTSIGANGVLTVEDLSLALERTGVPARRAAEAARVVDFNGSGQIEWSSFVAAMLPACHLGSAVDLTFKQLDLKNDGHIDRAELCELLKDGTIRGDEMSSPMASLQSDMMLREISGCSKQISMEDFQEWFARGSFFSPETQQGVEHQFSWPQSNACEQSM